MSKTPIGVTIVAILTLFVSFGSFAISAYRAFAIGIYYMTAGATGEPSAYPTNMEMPVIAYFLLALFALILAILLLVLGSRYIWYTSLVFWTLTCIVFASFTYPLWNDVLSSLPEGNMQDLELSIIQLAGLLAPYIYAVGCSAYFVFKKNVRNYFDV